MLLFVKQHTLHSTVDDMRLTKCSFINMNTLFKLQYKYITRCPSSPDGPLGPCKGMFMKT